MPQVEVRWRRSGGRGEFEHIPSDVLMGRRVAIAVSPTTDQVVFTDVRGQRRDGKPRLRRDDQYDRTMLNVPNLVAALALLPDPRREDTGNLALPLRDDGYVVSTLTFDAELAEDGAAVCTPLRMQVLHDPSVIDIASRLRAVNELIARADLPPDLADLAEQYRELIANGRAVVAFRELSSQFRQALENHPELSAGLDEPTLEIETEEVAAQAGAPALDDLSADETKRRLVSHYRIERDRKIAKEKVARFKAEHGTVHCEACAFSFDEVYGDYAKGVIDVHHIRPLASLLPNTLTKLSDLMLLCPNCHRVVHRKKTPLTPAELGDLLDTARAKKQG